MVVQNMIFIFQSRDGVRESGPKLSQATLKALERKRKSRYKFSSCRKERIVFFTCSYHCNEAVVGCISTEPV